MVGYQIPRNDSEHTLAAFVHPDIVHVSLFLRPPFSPLPARRILSWFWVVRFRLAVCRARQEPVRVLWSIRAGVPSLSRGTLPPRFAARYASACHRAWRTF